MVVAAVGRVLAVGCELWSEMWSVAGRQLMPERGPAGNRLHCIALHLQMLPRGCVLLSLVTRQRLAPPWTSTETCIFLRFSIIFMVTPL